MENEKVHYVPLVVMHAIILSFGDLVPFPPSWRTNFTTSFFKDAPITWNNMSVKGFFPIFGKTLAVELSDPLAEVTSVFFEESGKINFTT